MKSFFLISGFIFINLGPTTDGFTLVGSSKNEIVISTAEEVEKSEFTLENSSSEPINLAWRKKSNSLVAGWQYSVCAYGRCSIGIPDDGVFKTIQPGKTGFFALHLFPKEIVGNGKLEIEVFDPNYPEIAQLLVFDITVKPE
jgi:hypothetical protein